MNIPKTKVVVFQKGLVLAKNEQWSFVGQGLECANYFIYLGMTVSMQLWILIKQLKQNGFLFLS